MTILLMPHQERAIEEAIRTGQIASVEDLIDRAIASLRAKSEPGRSARTAAEQGLGLFGSPEDAALLDEIVTFAYTERGRPSQRTL